MGNETNEISMKNNLMDNTTAIDTGTILNKHMKKYNITDKKEMYLIDGMLSILFSSSDMPYKHMDILSVLLHTVNDVIKILEKNIKNKGENNDIK